MRLRWRVLAAAGVVHLTVIARRILHGVVRSRNGAAAAILAAAILGMILFAWIAGGGGRSPAVAGGATCLTPRPLPTIEIRQLADGGTEYVYDTNGDGTGD